MPAAAAVTPTAVPRKVRVSKPPMFGNLYADLTFLVL